MQRSTDQWTPIKHGTARARHASNVLGLMKAVKRAYFPNDPLGNVLDCIFLAIPILIAHVEHKPMTATRLARTLEMPRTTALRRLQWLTARGYVVKVGRSYRLTDKINVGGIERLMRLQLGLVEASARTFSSILDERA
jgi:predicted transcriptional regulator